MHPATVMFSCAHSRARARPVLTESLCVLHLQVNLARLLNGLGDTSLLHPDDSALGITVQRSELYDSLMLELRQEKEKNDQLRADLKKRCIDDRSVQGAIEPVRTELEMQHRDDLKRKLDGQSREHRQHMQRAREQHDLALQNALQKLHDDLAKQRRIVAEQQAQAVAEQQANAGRRR